MTDRDESRYTASVIIPAHNAASTIDSQLEALCNQVTSQPFEVIVVENGSNDSTAARARAWSDRIPDLTVIANGPRGASAARNEGARIARADLLLFCDADDVVSPLWVDVMVDTLAHSDAVAGPVSLSALNDANVVARSRGFPTGGLISARGFLPHARTANLGVRTTVFWELEGFDESYKFGEDTAFVWTLQLQGHTILEAADAIVEYRLRAEPAAAVRQARRWAESEVLLHRQFGPSGMPRRTIGQATRSWIYLGIRLAPSLRTPHTRVEWRRGIAKNVGRAIGSVRYHHFYP